MAGLDLATQNLSSDMSSAAVCCSDVDWRSILVRSIRKKTFGDRKRQLRQPSLRASDPHQTGFVDKGSDHRQLIKVWPSCAPGRGSVAGRKFLAPSY